jgi:excinuclease ABC subunit A
MADIIKIRGARVHNLKNVSLDIPRNAFVVFTGLSGSGKSSLAFDTIYAEGQRRYVESLSAYARQFLGLMDKPDVDQIDGLSPAIAIDQKSVTHNPRSTVGTVTEIYDYLRLLYARVGIPHCPVCGREVQRQTTEQIRKQVLAWSANTPILILAPKVRDMKGEHKHVFAEVRKAGYVRVRLDNIVTPLDEAESLELDKKKKHSIDVVIDRLTIGTELDKQRLTESLEAAGRLGKGLIIVSKLSSGAHPANGENIGSRRGVPPAFASEVRRAGASDKAGSSAKLSSPELRKMTDTLFSLQYACPHDGTSLPPIEPRNFSFNNPHGACPDCTGLGTKLEIDPELVIPNPKLSVAEGAIRPWSRSASSQTWYMRVVEAVAREHGFSLRVPVKSLPKKAVDAVLYGTGDQEYDVNNNSSAGKVRAFMTAYEGVIPNLMRRYKETDSDYIRTEIERYMRVWPCPTCKGKRLKPDALGVTVAGKNISEVTASTVERAGEFFDSIAKPKSLTDREATIAKQILKEIRARIGFLQNVGLDYLTLDRAASTLSGGESQRISLATQIGSSLVGVLYILDEPSIGLHQRDNAKLIETLKTLRDLGNTVLVVEHDEETIRAADHVVDIGPGAGEHGGAVVAQGSPKELSRNPRSLTGQYLSGKKFIPNPKHYRKGNGKNLTIRGASEFNLQKLTVKLPLGMFVCITGVSGSGKSTLITDILSRALAQEFYNAKDLPGKHEAITGMEHLDKVITIDQSPIGRTPRSNPATYTGVFTPIRDLFTQMPEAKQRGFGPGRFSFNVPGGRCEACEGDGLVRIEMHFLPDVYVECEECHGKRYSSQVLEIMYKGKTIADVLAMTVEESLEFFRNIPAIKAKLQTLMDVGLGYIHLGQSATTLSGGEAQRVKLATELSRRATGRTLYILDEPTTGLHVDDVKRLLGVLNQLVDKGNSVLVIEHNLDVIKSADWIVDLGPGGGDKGGKLVAEGRPRDVAKVKASYTGQYLKHVV